MVLDGNSTDIFAFTVSGNIINLTSEELSVMIEGSISVDGERVAYISTYKENLILYDLPNHLSLGEFPVPGAYSTRIFIPHEDGK